MVSCFSVLFHVFVKYSTSSQHLLCVVSNFFQAVSLCSIHLLQLLSLLVHTPWQSSIWTHCRQIRSVGVYTLCTFHHSPDLLHVDSTIPQPKAFSWQVPTGSALQALCMALQKHLPSLCPSPFQVVPDFLTTWMVVEMILNGVLTQLATASWRTVLSRKFKLHQGLGDWSTCLL